MSFHFNKKYVLGVVVVVVGVLLWTQYPYAATPHQIETTLDGDTLLITDPSTNLNGVSISVDTSASVSQRTVQRSSMQTNAIDDVSELEISIVPQKSIPDIRDEIQRVTDVFLVAQNLNRNVIITFPIVEIPDGYSVRNVDLYVYTTAEDVEGKIWIPISVGATEYAGTAENRIVKLSLVYLKEGMYFFGFESSLIPRDLALCEVLDIPQEQIDAAIAEAIEDAAIDNPWGNVDDFQLLLDQVEEKLNCTLKKQEDDKSSNVLPNDSDSTDNNGSQSSDNTDVTLSQRLSISNVSPHFGVAGDVISLTVKNTSDLVVVVLSGKTITPDSISDDNVVFTVPNDAVSGPLKISVNDKSSNLVWFNVSGYGLKAPRKDKIVNVFGTNMFIGYLIVIVTEETDTLENAQRLADIVSGSVIGRTSFGQGWQIEIDATTIEEAEAFVDMLKTDSTVESVGLDAEVKYDMGEL